MSELDRAGPPEPLTQHDIQAYRLIAETQQPPANYDVTRLVAIRLVDPDPYAPGRYIPHDPRAAAQSVTAAALRGLSDIVQRLNQVPALERLADDFDPHRLYGGPGSEFLASALQMNARVGEVCAAAATELCSAQPSEPADRDPAILRLGSSAPAQPYSAASRSGPLPSQRPRARPDPGLCGRHDRRRRRSASL